MGKEVQLNVNVCVIILVFKFFIGFFKANIS